MSDKAGDFRATMSITDSEEVDLVGDFCGNDGVFHIFSPACIKEEYTLHLAGGGKEAMSKYGLGFFVENGFFEVL